MTQPTPCPIVIEMVQYTPRRDGMTLQVSAADPLHPRSAVIGHSRQIQTRQRAVVGDDTASLGALTWSDEQVDAAAVAYCLEMLGVDVTIVLNYLPGEAPQDP
jgi:hypothetical protein